MAITVKDVAKKAGVATSTVSRVMSLTIIQVFLNRQKRKCEKSWMT